MSDFPPTQQPAGRPRFPWPNRSTPTQGNCRRCWLGGRKQGFFRRDVCGNLARMVADVDFVLESRSSRTVLLVEAKSTSAPSPEWAGRFARTLFAETAPHADLFFLLVLR